MSGHHSLQRDIFYVTKFGHNAIMRTLNARRGPVTRAYATEPRKGNLSPTQRNATKKPFALGDGAQRKRPRDVSLATATCVPSYGDG